MKTYGAWKVTEREYQEAKKIAHSGAAGNEDAYQLVRYCEGRIFAADPARRAGKAIRDLLASLAESSDR